MARIKYGALVTEIAGSIGGTTFQRNAYGFTIKNKPNVVIPNTNIQQVRKLGMRTVTTSWGELTQSERDAWDTYAELFPIPARLNTSSDLNGFNYFLKYHLLRNSSDNLAIIEDPGVIARSYIFDGVTLATDGTTEFLFNHEFESTSTQWRIIVQLTPPLPESRKIPRFTPRFIQGNNIADGSPPALSFDLDLTTDWLSVYSSLPQIGDFIGVRIIMLGLNIGQIVEVPVQTFEVVSV